MIGDPSRNGNDSQADQRGQQHQTSQLFADGNPHLDHCPARQTAGGRRVKASVLVGGRRSVRRRRPRGRCGWSVSARYWQGAAGRRGRRRRRGRGQQCGCGRPMPRVRGGGGGREWQRRTQRVAEGRGQRQWCRTTALDEDEWLRARNRVAELGHARRHTLAGTHSQVHGEGC